MFEDMHDLPAEQAEKEPVQELTLHIEDCPKCRGTGNWRPGYKCFKCKGKGKLEFKTSAGQRAKGRQSAVRGRAKKDAQMGERWIEFLAKREAIRDWLATGILAGNTFAISLCDAGKKYGVLTDGQEAAVLKAITRDADGKADFTEWCAEREGVLEWLTAAVSAGNEFAGSLMASGIRYGQLSDGQLNAILRNIETDKGTEGGKDSDIDLGELPKGYYAVPDGDTRLKLAVRRPGNKSRWFGWIMVDDGAAYGQRRKYGSQKPGELYKGGVQKELAAILKDPRSAAAEYGKLTGTCGMCGRILEDEESVARGLGPICAAK